MYMTCFQLFADGSNQKMASELSVELLQTFAVTLERLALIDDKPRYTVSFGLSAVVPFRNCIFVFYFKITISKRHNCGKAIIVSQK